MEAQASTSKEQKSIINRTKHVKTKIDLIKCVINSSDAVHKNPIFNSYTAMDRASFLTGFSEKQLKALKLIKNREKLVLGATGSIGPTPETRNAVRKIIHSIYLDDKATPTIFIIATRIPSYPELSSDQTSLDFTKKLLREHNYTWKKIVDNVNKWILVEEPKYVAARFEYLDKMIRYRRDKRQIVYVDVVPLTNNNVYGTERSRINIYDEESNKQVVFVAVSATAGLINHLVVKYNPEAHERVLESWLIDTIVPNLADATVIVMNDNLATELVSVKKPNKTALKAEMIEYLKSENIPFSLEFHRADLYYLIENHPYGPRNRIEELLKYYKIEVVRRPTWLLDFSVVEIFFKELRKNVIVFLPDTCAKTTLSIETFKDVVEKNLQEFSVQAWIRLNDFVEGHEERTMMADAELEETIEDLLARAKDGVLGTSDMAAMEYYASSDEDEDENKEVVVK